MDPKKSEEGWAKYIKRTSKGRASKKRVLGGVKGDGREGRQDKRMDGPYQEERSSREWRAVKVVKESICARECVCV